MAHYRQVHDRLIEELGRDPGPGLRELHQRILRQDPHLAAPDPPRWSGRPPRRRPVGRRFARPPELRFTPEFAEVAATVSQVLRRDHLTVHGREPDGPEVPAT